MSTYHGNRDKLNKRKKRKYELGREAAGTKIGEHKIKKVRVLGGNIKQKLVSMEYANVVTGNQPVRCKITELVENPANKDFTRRKVITKGAVLRVKLPDGKEIEARVTSCPGQDGVINAIAK